MTAVAAPLKTYNFRDPGPLTQVLSWALMADIGVRVLDAVVVFLTPSSGGGKGEAAALSFDAIGTLTLVSGVATLVVFITAAFLSLKWCYRVQMNAHALSQGLS